MQCSLQVSTSHEIRYGSRNTTRVSPLDIELRLASAVKPVQTSSAHRKSSIYQTPIAQTVCLVPNTSKQGFG